MVCGRIPENQLLLCRNGLDLLIGSKAQCASLKVLRSAEMAYFKASYCHVDSDTVMWEGVLLPTKLSENC